MDSDQESDFEFESSADAVFITSDFETEDDGQFFTPPNSPHIDDMLPQLTDDEASDDESEDDKESKSPEGLTELPLLLSDSEDEDDDPGPPGPRNRSLNAIFARPTPVDEGLALVTPGMWVGYSNDLSEEDDAAMLQEVFEHFEALHALKEAEATAVI